MSRCRNSLLRRARRAAFQRSRRAKQRANRRLVNLEDRPVIPEELIAPRLQVEGQVQPAQETEIYYMVVEGHQKLATLITLLNTKDPRKKFVVLMSSVEAVEYFSLILKHFLPSVTVMSIHEETKVPHKLVFVRFRDLKTTGLLVCTFIKAHEVINKDDVDWMFQFDPPWWSFELVASLWKKKLVFLQPSEESYTSFIHQKYQWTKMICLKLPADLPDNLAEIRQMQLNDRRLRIKANKAYGKYVRSYEKHEFIDSLRGTTNLDYGRVAVGYGLLKLPDCFKNVTSKSCKIDFFEPADVPWLP